MFALAILDIVCFVNKFYLIGYTQQNGPNLTWTLTPGWWSIHSFSSQVLGSECGGFPLSSPELSNSTHNFSSRRLATLHRQSNQPRSMNGRRRRPALSRFPAPSLALRGGRGEGGEKLLKRLLLWVTRRLRRRERGGEGRDDGICGGNPPNSAESNLCSSPSLPLLPLTPPQTDNGLNIQYISQRQLSFHTLCVANIANLLLQPCLRGRAAP